MKTLQEIQADVLREFEERFTEQDRGLRRRILNRNNISMTNMIEAFLSQSLARIAEATHEAEKVESKTVLDFPGNPNGTGDALTANGYNSAVALQESKWREFRGELPAKE